MPIVSYRGPVTPDVFAQVQRLHAGWQYWALPFIFPPAVAAAFWWSSPDSPSTWITAFVLGFLFPPYIWRSQNRRWEKTAEEIPYLNEDFEVNVTEDGLSYRSPSGTAFTPWSQYQRIKSSKDLLLLYQSRLFFHFVPAKLFASEEEWVLGKTTIESRIAANQRVERTSARSTTTQS